MKPTVIFYKNHEIEISCHNWRTMSHAPRHSTVTVISIIQIFHENGNKLTIMTFLHIRVIYEIFIIIKKKK